MYMLGCNYFWMLCEGIYLHTLIVVAVFAEEQHLHWYYLLGWGEFKHSSICQQSPNCKYERILRSTERIVTSSHRQLFHQSALHNLLATFAHGHVLLLHKH